MSDKQNINHEFALQSQEVITKVEKTPDFALQSQEVVAKQDKKDYSISNYDNPFELILAIMEDNKVDLNTVKLSTITDEYLKRIQENNLIDLEEASEFITIAATLLEIKVRNLLPKEEELILDEEDPEKMLLRRLEEYKLMKEACIDLQRIEDVDRFYKDPDEKVNDYRFVLKQMNMDNLLNAFTKMMIKIQQQSQSKLERKIERDRFTVAEKIEEIKICLNNSIHLNFTDLFDSDYSKSEIISTFQALLELMKIQFAFVTQNNLFDNILITKNEEYTNVENFDDF